MNLRICPTGAIRRRPVAILCCIASLAIGLSACGGSTESTALLSERVEKTTSSTPAPAVSSTTVLESTTSAAPLATTTSTTSISSTTSTTLIESGGSFTDLAAIGVGQCFVRPEDVNVLEIVELDTRSCDQPHDAQVFHRFKSRTGDDEDASLSICGDNQNQLSNSALRKLTDAAQRKAYFTDEQVVCFIHDPSGLEGSILAGTSEELEVGQCFSRPDTFLGGALESLDCASKHDSQFYYEFERPEDSDEDSLLEICAKNQDKVSAAGVEALSEEAQRRIFFTKGWALCFIYDPQGLESSILAN